MEYRGYYYDTETNLYYLQSRYCDPETCRFINADAYFVAGNDYIQGTNMFAYCYNNPVMYVDPTGYNSEDLYKFLASFVMLCGLANVGFVWWEPIIESDFSYEVIYGITEDVGNTLNWFYEIYDYEINVENSRILMDKITDMCTAIGQEVAVPAIDIMSAYFTADKIGMLFDEENGYGQQIKGKIDTLTLEVAAISIAFLGGFATALTGPIGWLVVGEIDMILTTALGSGVISDFLLWKEIEKLNGG